MGSRASSTNSGTWSKLPLVLSIAAGLVVFVVAARWLGEWSLIFAVSLGGAALAGFLYADGRLSWVDGYPQLSHLLMVYTSGISERPVKAAFTPSWTAPAAAKPPPAPTPPVAPMPAPDISGFVNFSAETDDAISSLDAVSSLIADQSLLKDTALPGVCILLTGPRGTGKTSVALTMPERLLKAKTVKKNRVFSISEADMRGLGNSYGPDADAVTNVLKGAREALDGVVVLDDLDHLASLGEGKALLAIGVGLLTLASRHPNRLLIVATGTGEAISSLDPRSRWLNQLDVKTIQFPGFDRNVIKTMATNLLEKEGFRVSAGALKMLGSQADDMVQERASFDNGHAVRRFVSRILANRRMRLRKSPPHDIREIVMEDVRDASWRIT